MVEGHNCLVEITNDTPFRMITGAIGKTVYESRMVSAGRV